MPPSEKELIMYQKATAFDILDLIESNPEKTYTPEELREIVKAYIKGLESK